VILRDAFGKRFGRRLSLVLLPSSLPVSEFYRLRSGRASLPSLLSFVWACLMSTVPGAERAPYPTVAVAVCSVLDCAGRGFTDG